MKDKPQPQSFPCFPPKEWQIWPHDECYHCGGAVEVYTDVSEGMLCEDDNARCAECGCPGIVCIDDNGSVYINWHDEPGCDCEWCKAHPVGGSVEHERGGSGEEQIMKEYEIISCDCLPDIKRRTRELLNEGWDLCPWGLTVAQEQRRCEITDTMVSVNICIREMTRETADEPPGTAEEIVDAAVEIVPGMGFRCAKCNGLMYCKQNEVEVHHKGTMRYGDLFACEDCGWMMVTGMGTPIERKADDR